MNRTITYQVSEEDGSLSVEQFLRRRGYSSRTLRELRKPEHLTLINGKFCTVKQTLLPGDRLEVCIRENTSSVKVPPEPIPISILYEDEDLLIIDKPAGLPVHPSRSNYHYSLANALAYYYQKQGKPFIFRCVNRLDRDTSGLTLIAKHFVSAGILSDQRQNGTLRKEYLGIACGCVTPEAGTIDAPLYREPGRDITRRVDFEKGERAVTHYQVLDTKNGYSLVSFFLETGRTHQIRAHMSYLGFPLAGDPIYNPVCAAAAKPSEEGLSAAVVPVEINGISRQALHAWRLSFTHPITGKPLSFTAPLPDDMQVFGFTLPDTDPLPR